MDAIYLAINGQSQGPYTLAQVRESLAKGEVSRATPAWYQGLAEWTTLGPILDSTGGASPAAVPPAPPFSSPTATAALVDTDVFTKDELRHIAKSQKLLMWAVLANILCGVASQVVGHMFPQGSILVGLLMIVVGLATIIFAFYAVIRLCTDLRYPTWAIALYCLSIFIPCVSLICLVVLSVRASKVLKAAGVRVGLMGGRVDDIPQ